MFSTIEEIVIKVGLDPLKAYDYTPYELTLLAKQKANDNQERFEELLTLAWHVEAFARQKKLPKLEKVIKDARKPRKKEVSRSDAILKKMAAEKGVIL